MSATDNRPVSSPEPAYERLRTRALDPRGPREMGYGLLVQRGMLAWMRTATACASAGRQTPYSTTVRLAAPLEGELVRTLVSLIVDNPSIRSLTPTI